MTRYGLEADDLRKLSKLIVMGKGLAERIQESDGVASIEQAEYWAEAQVASWMGVPLKPFLAPGESVLPSPPTKTNYPFEFIQAILYYSLSRLLSSEFSESRNSASELVIWCEQQARQHLFDLRSRRTTRVGAGRLRHPNPFMPPNISRPEEPPQQQFS